MTGAVLALTVPHPMGEWLYHVEDKAWFSPECLASLTPILCWWPDQTGLTLKATDGTAAYSLFPPDEHRVRKGVLVYADHSERDPVRA